MEMTVEQAMFNVKSYEYKFFMDDKLAFVGKANRTVIPIPRKIWLYDDVGKELCSLRQENLRRFIISNIPLIGFFQGQDCPFNFYCNGLKQGSFVEKYFNLSGLIEGTVNGFDYFVYGHTGNAVSIFAGEKQIALIKRNAFKNWDADRYKVIFSSTASAELIAILTIFSDITWETADRSVSSFSWEYTVQIGGKKLDKNWTPD